MVCCDISMREREVWHRVSHIAGPGYMVQTVPRTGLIIVTTRFVEYKFSVKNVEALIIHW